MSERLRRQERAVLSALTRMHPDPMLTHEVATATGMERRVAKRALVRLVKAGLIDGARLESREPWPGTNGERVVRWWQWRLLFDAERRHEGYKRAVKELLKQTGPLTQHNLKELTDILQQEAGL